MTITTEARYSKRYFDYAITLELENFKLAPPFELIVQISRAPYAALRVRESSYLVIDAEHFLLLTILQLHVKIIHTFFHL